ncbi:guanine deaminase, putative [Babesia ovata]|uniref:Guanine deaminase, putative n=1 Tax=Babesia ovata TaxID=189622 RepID=A0A2H6KH08_9APIC|nr:guanine deaminase, putative [Babesia ovata]GBE62275.1 guanine deaminase, putative [Babesia ovata]
MRNSDGALKCCRCRKEGRDASHSGASVSSDPVRNASTGIGERHKYSVVSEYGLDSCELGGIHGADGDRVLSTLSVGKRAVGQWPVMYNVVKAPFVAADDRSLQQLCLLRVELSKALDRYTGLLHHSNESVSCDVRSEVLDALDRTLRLLSTVEARL